MDYAWDTPVTWGMMVRYAEGRQGQLVYLNMPSWFWPLVFAGVIALCVIALCVAVRTVMDAWRR